MSSESSNTNQIASIDVHNIKVINPINSKTDATGTQGTLYGSRPNYTCLFVHNQTINTPLQVGMTYSFKMENIDDKYVLGVELKYTSDEGPGRSLIFGNPNGDVEGEEEA